MAIVPDFDQLLWEGLDGVRRGEEGSLDVVLVQHLQRAIEANGGAKYSPRYICSVGGAVTFGVDPTRNVG